MCVLGGGGTVFPIFEILESTLLSYQTCFSFQDDFQSESIDSDVINLTNGTLHQSDNGRYITLSILYDL